MSVDSLDDGECCSFCGEPVFFRGQSEAECPNCGADWVSSGQDAGD